MLTPRYLMKYNHTNPFFLFFIFSWRKSSRKFPAPLGGSGVIWDFTHYNPQRWSTSPVMGDLQEVKRYAPWSFGSPRDAPEVRVHLRFLPPRWSTVMNPTTILCHTNPCCRTIMLYQYFSPALYLMGPIVLLLMALLLRTVPEGSDFLALWLVCSRSSFHSAIEGSPWNPGTL